MEAERAPDGEPNEGQELSEAFLRETIRVWQPHYEEKLTMEDAREIVGNVSGFLRTLAEWRKASDDQERAKAQVAGNGG